MTKNELINDMNFRLRCIDYGLNWMNFEIFNFRNGDSVIAMVIPNKEIYILFDKNYNTICIEKSDAISDYEDLKYFVELKYNIYCDCSEYVSLYENQFGYPFQNFSLKNILDLTNRINTEETNHGHSSEFYVNGDLIIGDNDETYIGLLSYIKFIGEQIKQYYLSAYQMKMIGFDYPDVYSYVNSIITNINECVNQSIENNIRPYPVNILTYIGQNNKNIEQYNYYLYNIINLLIKEKGYKVKRGIEYYKEIEPTEKITEDLSILSTKLLKILEVSDEEVKQKIDYTHATLEIECIDLNSWIEDKSKTKTKSK